VAFPFIQCAFAAERRKVVRANAARPRGPGSAMGAAAAAGCTAGVTSRSSLTLITVPPS
jgi:hypothetical protein